MRNNTGIKPPSGGHRIQKPALIQPYPQGLCIPRFFLPLRANMYPSNPLYSPVILYFYYDRGSLVLELF